MINDNNELEVFQLSSKDGKIIEIPLQGCLGLLALGDIGLIAWRQKKEQYIASLSSNTSNHLQ